jgi:hypothetical protein
VRLFVVGSLFVATALCLAACTKQEEAPPPLDAAAYKDDLDTLSHSRIFFGHQSVGRNLIQGLSDLSQADHSGLRIVRLETIATPEADAQTGFFHTDIGVNSDPIGKVKAFKGFLLQQQPGFDAALLKFCYVDLGADGMHDPSALLDQYAQSVAEIRAAQPGLRLIHVTSPLRADPPGRRTAVKRLLHLSTDEDADNIVRNSFNADLRRRFAGEPIFDIAEVESTLPDGTRTFFTRDGERIYTLANLYTDDGGHLNAIGRQYVSAAFARAIANTLRAGAP